MTTVLDMDIADVGGRLKQAWTWWTGELRAMAAPLLRRRGSSAQLPVVDLTAEGRLLLSTPTGAQEVDEPPRRPVALCLPQDLVLRRVITVPLLSARDIERMVTLDGDRLTPFAQGEAYHHVRIADLAVGAAGRSVELTSIARETADAGLAAARAAGLRVAAVWIAGDPSDPADLLPQMTWADAQGSTRRRLAWTLALALVALNVGVSVWRDVRATQDLEARASSARAAALRAATVAQQNGALRTHLAQASVAQGDVLLLLDAVARTAASGVTMQRLDWRPDGTVVTGAKPAPLDLAAIFRSSGSFSAVDPVEPPGPASPERFELRLRTTSLRGTLAR